MIRNTIYIILALSALLSLFFSALSAKTRREPVVAGQFYPADKEELLNMVRTHLDNVGDQDEIDGELIALIVPHAGLIYSGQIAAHAYKLLEKSNINNVILCGPSHHHSFYGLSVYGPYITWQTPLGYINCDPETGKNLMEFGQDRIDYFPEAHSKEHSIEVQLPYLQTVLDSFTITPIAMGQQTAPMINLLTKGLKILNLGSNSILIASTDLQHYRNSVEGYALDSVVISCIENLDPVRLERSLKDKTAEMCGGGPTVSVLKAAIARGANKVKILKYGNSGDISGDNNSVVGYVAAAIYKEKTNNESSSSTTKPETKISTNNKSVKDQDEKIANDFNLNTDDKKALLKIARESINAHLNGTDLPEFNVSDNLKKYGAGFVTLEKNHRLRGCIGYTSAVGPLYQTISECAIKAAVNDVRFPPVKITELGKIHIEISVLSLMQKVESLDEIKVGRDGLMIFKGAQRGLLLPQVATENGWDKQTFLEQTCLKAGLSANAYKSEDAVLYKFQAVIFSEDSIGK